MEIRRRVGYLPGELALYENLTDRELVEYIANLRGLSDRRFADELYQRLDLDPRTMSMTCPGATSRSSAWSWP